jgi:hypothetical protein
MIVDSGRVQNISENLRERARAGQPEFSGERASERLARTRSCSLALALAKILHSGFRSVVYFREINLAIFENVAMANTPSFKGRHFILLNR